MSPKTTVVVIVDAARALAVGTGVGGTKVGMASRAGCWQATSNSMASAITISNLYDFNGSAPIFVCSCQRSAFSLQLWLIAD